MSKPVFWGKVKNKYIYALICRLLRVVVKIRTPLIAPFLISIVIQLI